MILMLVITSCLAEQQQLSVFENRVFLRRRQLPSVPSQTSLLSLQSPSHKVKLLNFANTQFVGTVGVGNPAQYFEVIFDTGSSNFWVTSARCEGIACKSHKAYDGSRSLTYEELGYFTEVEFGTGSIKGEINRDTVNIAGYNIPTQTIGEITDEFGEVFLEGKFSGILGLGFPSLAAPHFTPVFDSLMRTGDLSSNLFSFYYSEDDSQVIFGDIDHALYQGDIVWTDVIQEYYWLIIVDEIRLGDTVLCNHCNAAVDTGTSLITAPSEMFSPFLVSGCDIPRLTFVIEGELMHLDQEDLLIKNCNLGIMPLDVPKPQ